MGKSGVILRGQKRPEARRRLREFDRTDRWPQSFLPILL
jgi:hypothetical protein